MLKNVNYTQYVDLQNLMSFSVNKNVGNDYLYNNYVKQISNCMERSW